ncbi:MAG: hypothetical protein QM760_07525 [Nibricoccus sp.]
MLFATDEKAQPAATAQRLDGVRFEFPVASSAWLTSDRWTKPMPISRIPSVDVCIHRDEDRVLLIHRATTIDSDGLYRGDLPFGSEETFTTAEFERQAVGKIRDSFIQFADRTGIPDSEVGSFSKKKWLQILRDHRIVGVSLQEAGHWHLAPFYHTRAGRYRGDDELVWMPTSGPEDFFRLLRMAADRAELKKKRSQPNGTDNSGADLERSAEQ